MGKDKVFYIEVLSNSDGEEEAGRAQGNKHNIPDDEQPRMEDKDFEQTRVEAKGGTISTLSGGP
jgi:hypothetical protein